MDQGIARDLINVFRQIDEIRGIVQIIEPAPPCPKCEGFGRLTVSKKPYHVRMVCSLCRGTGWAALTEP